MKQTTKHTNRGAWLVLAAAACWGTTGTAQAFAPDGATPLAIGAVRLAVGGTALLLLALSRRRLHRQGWRPWPTAIAISGIALYQVCFFSAVRATGVAAGTVVAIGSAPILAGLIGLVFLGERPTPRWIVATAFAVVGCTLLVTGGGELTVNPLGVLLALGAGGSYAAYTAASKELLRAQHPDAVSAVAFFGGARRGDKYHYDGNDQRNAAVERRWETACPAMNCRHSVCFVDGQAMPHRESPRFGLTQAELVEACVSPKYHVQAARTEGWRRIGGLTADA